MNDKNITIKKKDSVIVIQRKDLMDLAETHDGMTFKMKNGIDIYMTDAYMPSHYKRAVKAAVDKFDKSNIIVDLSNTKSPVSITNT